MINNQSALSLMRKRYSCRSYQQAPIPQSIQTQLRDMLSSLPPGPMGTRSRFQLLAADDEDRQAIKGLTTYGFIKNPMGFIAGVTSHEAFSLVDFGYLMEYAVLYATSLDLGTVWLGGTFNKGRFGKKMQLSDGEQLPAVTAIGLIASTPRFIDAIMRQQVNSENRKEWAELFFKDSFDSTLSREDAGEFSQVIAMVQRAPSASNKQPWRIVKVGNLWHFYLQRTALYHPRNVSLVGVADMQRIDMGIAMCHFELSAREMGLPGQWSVQEPTIQRPNILTEYIVSWDTKE